MAIAKKSTPKKTKAVPKEAAPKKAAKVEKPAPKAVKASDKAPKAATSKTKKTTKTADAETSTPSSVPAASPVQAALPAMAQSILSAIQEGRAVEFIFSDADANAPRTFEPRQLSFDALSQAWYVFGWDRRYNAERHHRLDLLAEVNPVEGLGRGAQGPFPEGAPGNQIGGWLGGDAIIVKATLQKQWVFAIKQAPPAFPHFKLVDKEDGKAEVSFSATDLRAIARWVMQFGDGITVQEPQRLSDRLRQVASVWAGKDLAKMTQPPAQERPQAPARPAEPREDRPRHAEPKAEPRSSSKVEVRIERL